MTGPSHSERRRCLGPGPAPALQDGAGDRRCGPLTCSPAERKLLVGPGPRRVAELADHHLPRIRPGTGSSWHRSRKTTPGAPPIGARSGGEKQKASCQVASWGSAVHTSRPVTPGFPAHTRNERRRRESNPCTGVVAHRDAMKPCAKGKLSPCTPCLGWWRVSSASAQATARRQGATCLHVLRPHVVGGPAIKHVDGFRPPTRCTCPRSWPGGGGLSRTSLTCAWRCEGTAPRARVPATALAWQGPG